MDAIVVNNVSKSYGRVQALCDVSFAVGKGEVFGLIGPDGAGKTSMFRILCSLLLPDAGTAVFPNSAPALIIACCVHECSVISDS